MRRLINKLVSTKGNAPGAGKHLVVVEDVGTELTVLSLGDSFDCFHGKQAMYGFALEPKTLRKLAWFTFKYWISTWFGIRLWIWEKTADKSQRYYSPPKIEEGKKPEVIIHDGVPVVVTGRGDVIPVKARPRARNIPIHSVR